ncbi:putative sufE-like protein 1, chloroplastic/mitochondrial [Iris pallida]|uniref:SufE-like protein 1, chloroplastic/mitochondrial n=1 Tax=Iris pallida TaxID=29817 RepID=A0AAX6FQZ5_IRIPA|nr:putative sufE-like protein 1, chloroplastic/mitochondrial [Iris pallida]
MALSSQFLMSWSSSSIGFNSLSLFSSPRLSRASSSISFQRILSSPSPPPPMRATTTIRAESRTSLPSKLQSMVDLFQSVPDSKLKYRQLLDYGSRLPPYPPEFRTDAHRVRGCVSQVWIRAYPDPADPSRVRFDADSDSQLTKGLAALLVNGLSGETPSAVASVSPDFVSLLGLSQSLTPSRNNGFLNMLRTMQQEALKLAAPAGTRKERIRERLERSLSPAELEVEDVSHLHAGHAGVGGSSGGESHFNVRVVSEGFRDMSLVERHRLVYDILRDELESGLHALSIVAKTPEED